MKRKLRPSIRKALEIITVMLGICLMSVYDFELRAIPFLLLAVIAEICNVKILEKF